MRCAEGRTEGEVIINGNPKNQRTFTRVMGYVEQFDIHSPQVRLSRVGTAD